MTAESTIDTLRITFGLSCWSGDSLILFDAGQKPVPPRLYAVYGAQVPISISFLRFQEPVDGTGRITADKFSSITGYVFLDPSAQLPSDQTILVVDSAFLVSHVPLEVHDLGYVPLDSSTVQRIETLRQLRVQSSWTIARLGQVARASLVLFYPSDSTQILSLALIESDAVSFEDHISDRYEEQSKWRVDDGGEFDPQYYVVTAAFDSMGTCSLVRSWAGPEGDNSVLYTESNGRLVPVLEAYRYWVPE